MAISYPLDYRDINPVIRIAHRSVGPLVIARRIIFDFELVLITNGNAEFRSDDVKRPLAPGDLLLIKPFLAHEFHSRQDKTIEHIAVHFDLASAVPPMSTDVSRRAAYDVRLSDGLRLPEFIPNAGSEIGNELAALVRAWEDPRPPAALEARLHLLRVLLLLLNTGAGVKEKLVRGELRDQKRIERTIRYIDQHLSEQINAADLATVAGLSPSQMARLFREHTGHAPMQYLRRMRIERARRLLANVDLSIKEIAAQCGFQDPFHFTKVFHQIDGLPPTLFREALLAGRATRTASSNSIISSKTVVP